QAGAAAPALLEALKDPDVGVRHQALVALRTVRGDPAVVLPALVKRLKEEDANVRTNLVQTIAAHGSAALPYLAEAFKDKDANVRGYAVWSLHQVQGDLQPVLP